MAGLIYRLLGGVAKQPGPVITELLHEVVGEPAAFGLEFPKHPCVRLLQLGMAFTPECGCHLQ